MNTKKVTEKRNIIGLIEKKPPTRKAVKVMRESVE